MSTRKTRTEPWPGSVKVLAVTVLLMVSFLTLGYLGFVPRGDPSAVPTLDIARIFATRTPTPRPTATLTSTAVPTLTPTRTPTPVPKTWLPEKDLPTTPPESLKLIGSSELVLVESQGQKLVCGIGGKSIFCLDRQTLELKRQIKLPSNVWGLAAYRGVIFAGLSTEAKILIVPLDTEVRTEWAAPSVPGRLFAGEFQVSKQPVLLVPGKSSFQWSYLDPDDPAKKTSPAYVGLSVERGYSFIQGVAVRLKGGQDDFFLVGRDGVQLGMTANTVRLEDFFQRWAVFHAIGFLPEWQTVFALTEGKVVRWNLGNDFVDELPVCSYLPNLGVTLLLDPRPTRRGSFWLSCPAEDRVVYYDHYGELKWQAEGKKPMGLVFDSEISRLFVSFEDGLGVFEVSH